MVGRARARQSASADVLMLRQLWTAQHLSLCSLRYNEVSLRNFSKCLTIRNEYFTWVSLLFYWKRRNVDFTDRGVRVSWIPVIFLIALLILSYPWWHIVKFIDRSAHCNVKCNLMGIYVETCCFSARIRDILSTKHSFYSVSMPNASHGCFARSAHISVKCNFLENFVEIFLSRLALNTSRNLRQSKNMS